MKELLLKIAGVKTEEAFYKKFPTKEAFFKAHPEAKEILANYKENMESDEEEEDIEEMANGGNVPTNPALWSRAKAAAKSKYDVYPSAYANGFAAKWYKEKGGKWKKAAMGGYVDEYAEGGGIDNPGFKALPKAVQENIIANMEMGGYVEEMADGGIPQRYKNMGFTRVGQKKQGDGKHKWKVLAKKGDQYKVVQGGWRGMEDFKQHKSEKRRDNFWSRMGGKNSAKAKDPFSPLYWHKRFGTWADGGIIPEMEDLILVGENMYNMGGVVEYPTYYPGGGMVESDMIDYQVDYTYPTMYPDGGSVNKWKKLLESAKDVWVDQPVKAFNNSQFKKDLDRFPEKIKEVVNIYTTPELRERYDNYQMGNKDVRGLTKEEIENNKKYELELLERKARGEDNFQYPMKYKKIGNENNLVNSRFINGGMIAGPIMGYEDEMFEYAMGGGININPANKGKFTAWAKKRGMSVKEAANKVMANKEKYTADVVRMANFAKNAATWKKQDGGELDVFSAFTNKVPVQTETYEGQPEQVVLPNGMIESVDAKTRHENMADDEITDILPQGSHIQSSRNKLTADQYATLMEMFKPETAEKDIKMLEQVYKAKYGKKKNKELSPADITEYAKKAYQRTPTPNNFDTEKLVEGNKQSFVDLGMTMNDLIKSGKEMASQGMAYGGMINKYQSGTDGNTGVSDEGTSNWVNPIAADYKTLTDMGILRYDPTINKLRANFPPNMPYEQKVPFAQAVEQMGLQNVRQSKTPGYDTFYGGITPSDFARYFVENTSGKAYDKNVSEKQVLKDFFNTLGYEPTEKQLSDPKTLFGQPQFQKAYQAYVSQTPGMRESFGIPTLGDTPALLGIQQLKAMPKKEPAAEPAAVVTTPEGKVVRVGNMGNYTVTGTAPQQMPKRSRYYSGLLEGQLGRNLSANEAELQAYLSNTPLYQMETPDTYIRSRKNEVPVGNILYNIERAQRNAANALANQTGDWSTLASNIANQGAIAMNQVGDTLSNLNLQNINLYNQTQGLQQNLLEKNMGIRNWNLYNKQKLTNEKRNLFGQKAVKDAEMYSNYINKLSENQQKEEQSKTSLLALMGAYPETFRGGPGQEMSNRILNTYGAYNNPLIGTPLDYFLNR